MKVPKRKKWNSKKFKKKYVFIFFEFFEFFEFHFFLFGTFIFF